MRQPGNQPLLYSFPFIFPEMPEGDIPDVTLILLCDIIKSILEEHANVFFRGGVNGNGGGKRRQMSLFIYHVLLRSGM